MGRVGRASPQALARRLAPALLLLASTGAQALQLEVDPSGGPLVLEERVAEALAAWRDAGVQVEATERRLVVRYGDPDLLGPDVPVLLLTAGGADGGLELLVHPELLEEFPAALVHAVGIALGGQLGPGEGATRLTPGARFEPSAEQAAAIEAARRADPADLSDDGVVDFEDLLLLAARFGDRGLNLPGDLDGDGVIDERDVELLRERYVFSPLNRTAPPEALRDDEPASPEGLPEVPAPLDEPQAPADLDAPDDPPDPEPGDLEPEEPQPEEPQPEEPQPEEPGDEGGAGG